MSSVQRVFGVVVGRIRGHVVESLWERWPPTRFGSGTSIGTLATFFLLVHGTRSGT